MNKKEIVEMVEQKISSCRDSLTTARTENFPKLYIEGFRSRLDELILLYQQIKDVSFNQACFMLGVNKMEISQEV